MRGQGWPLGEEEDKRRRGSNRVSGEKKGSVSRENRCTAFVVGWTVLFLQMELLGAGQEPDSALPKTSAVGSLC